MVKQKGKGRNLSQDERSNKVLQWMAGSWASRTQQSLEESNFQPSKVICTFAQNVCICTKWLQQLENRTPHRSCLSGCWMEKYGWWRVMGWHINTVNKHPRKSGQSANSACYRSLNLWASNPCLRKMRICPMQVVEFIQKWLQARVFIIFGQNGYLILDSTI